MRKEYYQANKLKVLASNAAYRKTNEVKLNKYKKEWRKQNWPTLLAKRKQYYQRNKSRTLEYGRKYRLEHKHQISKWQKEYAKAHPEVGAKTDAKRRAAKLITQSDGPSIRRWMVEVRSKPFARCYWCGTKVCGRRIHFDHIVALAKGGTHTIGNLCASCPECNHSKSARLISDWICKGQSFLSL